MGIYKDKKRGTWYYRTRLYDEDGSFIKHACERGFETKKEAKEAMEKRVSKCKSPSENDKIFFSEVKEHYLEWYKNQNKYSSYKGINSLVKLHIAPVFDKKIIHKVKPKDIIDWQLQLKKKGTVNGRYLQKCYIYLNSIFNHAGKYFDLEKNPCKYVGNFKIEKRKRINFWTFDNFVTFIKCVDDIKYHALFSTLFFTGLRKGELLQLQWSDIDFKNNEINIEFTVTKDGDGGWELTAPKTKDSERVIVLDNNTKDELLRYKEYCKKIIGFNDDFFVFGDINPLAFSTLDRHYIKYRNLSKLKNITIHDFRHSHAAFLISIGWEIQAIAERLGHGDISMTFNVYGHLYPNRQRELVKGIDRFSEKCSQIVPKVNETTKKMA